MKTFIYDHLTGEQIERDMTAEELEVFEKQAADRAAEKQAEAEAKAEAEIKRAAILQRLGLTEEEAKLATLGLTSDDLKALGL